MQKATQIERGAEVGGRKRLEAGTNGREISLFIAANICTLPGVILPGWPRCGRDLEEGQVACHGVVQ